MLGAASARAARSEIRLRYVRGVEGFAVVLACALIFAGPHHAHFVLSMIFATRFLADGLLQCTSAWMVRYQCRSRGA